MMGILIDRELVVRKIRYHSRFGRLDEDAVTFSTREHSPVVKAKVRNISKYEPLY